MASCICYPAIGSSPNTRVNLVFGTKILEFFAKTSLGLGEMLLDLKLS